MGILNDIYNQTKLCGIKNETKDDKDTKDKENVVVSDKDKKNK